MNRVSVLTARLAAALVASSMVAIGIMAIDSPSRAQAPAAAAPPATDAGETSKQTDAEKEIANSPTEDLAERAKPKPISEQTKRGLKYLVSQQHSNGGWGQGGGWRTKSGGGRQEGENVKDPPDVGNTCIAALALMRAGNTPTSGPYSKQLNRAIEFIQRQVKAADEKSMYVTDIRNTQLQSKIGVYVDTFLTGQVLAELKGQMPNEQAEKELFATLNKTINKIAINQKEDGTFEGNSGWASVLSQGIASKAMNFARAKGVKLSEEVIVRDAKQAQQMIAAASTPTPVADSSSVATATSGVPISRVGGYGGGVGGGAYGAGGYGGGLGGAAYGGGGGTGDAGVALYSLSANTNRANAYGISAKNEIKRYRGQLADKTLDDATRKEIKEKVAYFEQAEAEQTDNLRLLVRQASDERFLKGFGNNGGEEFLSYMNISESLFVKGGKEWDEWDKSITKGIQGFQNKDGSWSGHHCITGRTFCTSAAILCLLADRMPVPEAE